MKLTVDQDKIVAFLVDLLNTPSPTGYHEEACQCVIRTIEALAIPDLVIERNRKGSVLITLPGAADDQPRATSAHIDTLGAMVRQVKSNGRLLLVQLGGYAWNAVEGENVTVHTRLSGRRFRGTIQTITPSVHTSRDAREGKRDDERMEVRLDVRSSSKEETVALGIGVGDFVYFDPRVEVTDTSYVKSRHLDNKAGVAVLYGALEALAASSQRPAQRTTLMIGGYEETGHGAATGIPADVADYVVLDMAASTTGEFQNSDEYSVGICAKDATGPYDLSLTNHLAELCSAHQIAYNFDTYPNYGSDGSAFLRAGGDVRVGLIGPGIDASHAYERTHIDSLVATTRLLLAWLLTP
ncbi:MAG: M42 family metallopeptidase [Chloroflexi bacterium]|nr:M42 family metallopeptidase [Chloroflexota bacterium]